MRRLIAWLSWQWGYWRYERPAARQYDRARGYHLPLEQARRAREAVASHPQAYRRATWRRPFVRNDEADQ